MFHLGSELQPLQHYTISNERIVAWRAVKQTASASLRACKIVDYISCPAMKTQSQESPPSCNRCSLLSHCICL